MTNDKQQQVTNNDQRQTKDNKHIIMKADHQDTWATWTTLTNWTTLTILTDQ